MPTPPNREEQAFAYFRQAGTDRDFAVAAYRHLASQEVDGRTDFFCCIIAHCQQAIEKAVKQKQRLLHSRCQDLFYSAVHCEINLDNNLFNAEFSISKRCSAHFEFSFPKT